MKTITSTILFLWAGTCLGQILPEINALIESELKSKRVPALAVVVIDSGSVVHLSANGYKDWDKKIEATTDTPFHIASVSKTITNLAIFKLVEAGKIDLNTDINKYLPFEVNNPHYPADKITVRALLNHRSGVRDDYGIYGPLWSEPKGDPTTGLVDFLKDYLNENGKLYKKEHFESGPEYKLFAYSNTGVALLGLIIETVSKSSYEDFCQEKIFKPLAMRNTSWFLKNLDKDEVAKTYIYDDSLGLQFKGHNGYPDYPAGQLRTSIADFSKVLVGYLNAKNNEFILDWKTVNRITPNPYISQEGYFTWFMTTMGDNLYYTHGGSDTGVRTVVVIDVVNKNAIAIFANAKYGVEDLLKGVEKEMWGK